MKATLILNNPLWATPARRKILSRVVKESAAELEGEIKKTILDSTPKGRLYRRGSITRRATAPLVALGLRKVKGNRKRVIAGAKIHRASAKGQAPAVDSGGLVNSIRAKDISELRSKVATGKKYGSILDSPAGLDRPFFEMTANKFKEKFKKNLAEAIKEAK